MRCVDLLEIMLLSRGGGGGSGGDGGAVGWSDEVMVTSFGGSLRLFGRL